MKFLLVFRPLVLLATALTLNACDTPANRRQLYNTSEPNGPWHDYARRGEAETAVGLPPGSTATNTNSMGVTPRNTRPTPQPRSGPLSADPTSLPSTNMAAPSNTTTTTVSPAAAPAPMTPGESAPASTSSEQPAAPPGQ